MSKKEQTLIDKEILERGELQIALMKMMAEQNKEKFLEYDRTTDTAILSEIQDGRFTIMETVEGFTSVRDIEASRIYEKEKGIYGGSHGADR